MIQVGFVADKQDTVCLFKTSENRTFTAGLALAGFGTKPYPGTAYDDAIYRAVNYAAKALEEVLDALQDKGCEDMDQVAYHLGQQLKTLNADISYFSRNAGQGAYVAGVISYVAGEKFVCLPFGGAYACLWDQTMLLPLRNLALPEGNDPRYIRDALGGCGSWQAVFTKGKMPVGAHLLCMTQQPRDGQISNLTQMPGINDPRTIAATLYSGMAANDIPRGALVLTRVEDPAPAPEGGEEASDGE